MSLSYLESILTERTRLLSRQTTERRVYTEEPEAIQDAAAEGAATEEPENGELPSEDVEAVPLINPHPYPSLKRALELVAAELADETPSGHFCWHYLTPQHLSNLIPLAPESPTRNASFTIALALYIQIIVTAKKSTTPLQKASVSRTARQIIDEFWDVFRQDMGWEDDIGDETRDSGELLWMPVLLAQADDVEPGSSTQYLGAVWTTVAELLDVTPRTSLLVEYPPIAWAVEYSWMYGAPIHHTRTPSRYPAILSLKRRLSALTTPRVSHLLDAAIFTAYLISSIHIVTQGLRESFNAHDTWVITYSAYSLLPYPSPLSSFFPWLWKGGTPMLLPRKRKYYLPRRFGFLLVLLAYFLPLFPILLLRLFGSYPLSAGKFTLARPQPQTLPHFVLLASIGWNAFRLIVAPYMSPGWVLLFPLRSSLIPALEFQRFLWPVVGRPVLYFAPLLLGFGLVLSLSMDDPWNVQVQTTIEKGINGLMHMGRPDVGEAVQMNVILPAPYDTREAFFSFFLLALCLWFFFALASLIRVAASFSLSLVRTSPSSSLQVPSSPTGANGRHMSIYSALAVGGDGRSPTSPVGSRFLNLRPEPPPTNGTNGTTQNQDQPVPRTQPSQPQIQIQTQTLRTPVTSTSYSPDDGSDEDDAPLRPDAARLLLHYSLLYGSGVGATTVHNPKRYFPVPLSALSLLFIELPTLLLSLFMLVGPTASSSAERQGRETKLLVERIMGWLDLGEEILWWIFVWPPSVLLAAVWGWGSGAPADWVRGS
ncbi:hypothetical protein DL93DRAFT_2089157 [Clavulina sp. PMI_390]|nr:hypothetical protein DL93DRAFT_2089157 [Clavulina sp. PMI_390]